MITLRGSQGYLVNEKATGNYSTDNGAAPAKQVPRRPSLKVSVPPISHAYVLQVSAIAKVLSQLFARIRPPPPPSCSRSIWAQLTANAARPTITSPRVDSNFVSASRVFFRLHVRAWKQILMMLWRSFLQHLRVWI